MSESVINVLDREVVADWDGTTGTDNRAAIQAIIDAVTNPACVDYGKPIHFPRGRYWADSLDPGGDTHTFNVPDDLVVFGDGPAQTLIHVGPSHTAYLNDVFYIRDKKCNFSIGRIHLEGGPTTALLDPSSPTAPRGVYRRAVFHSYVGLNIRAPTVTPAVTGEQYYEYRVIGKGLDGTFVSSEPGVTSRGHATLSDVNKNTITWTAHSDADGGYDIARYRGVGTANGKIGSVAAGVTTFDDTGQIPTAFPQNNVPKTVRMENCRVTYLSHALSLATDGVDAFVADCDIRHESIAIRHFDANGGPFWRSDGQEYRSKLTVNRCQILYATNPNVVGEHTGYHYPSIDVTYDSCTLDSVLIGVQINNQDSAVPERGGSLAVTNTIFGSGCAVGINGHQGTPTMVTNCVFICRQYGVQVQTGGALIQGCQFRLASATAIAGISILGGLELAPCLVSNCYFDHSAMYGQIYNQQEATQPIVFSNCVFKNPAIEPGQSYSVVQQNQSGNNGTWEFVNCTWDLVGSMRLPLFYDARKVTFRGCTLRSKKFLGVTVGTTTATRRTELVLEDCTIDAGASPSVLINETRGRITVRGRNNEFLGAGPAAPAGDPPDFQPDPLVIGYLTPRQEVGAPLAIAGGGTKITLNANSSVFHVRAAAAARITRIVLTSNNNDHSTRYFHGPFTLIFDDANVTIANSSSERRNRTGRIKPLSTAARAAGSVARFLYDVSKDVWYEI